MRTCTCAWRVLVHVRMHAVFNFNLLYAPGAVLDPAARFLQEPK